MASITGIIRNSENVGLEEVSVLVVSGPSHNDVAALTGADGRFSLNNLKPGNYVLKAYGQVESGEIPVQVLSEKSSFVEIWL